MSNSQSPNLSPVWISIPATDVARAAKFYQTVFNLQLRPDLQSVDSNSEYIGFDLNKDIQLSGGIMKVPDSLGALKTGPGGACLFWNVDDIEKIGEVIESAGGKNLTGVQNEGTNLRIRYFVDTEGNTGGAHQLG